MLAVRRKTGIRNGARPERTSIVLLGRQNNVLRAGITKDLRPRIRIPFLNILIKYRCEVVIVVVGAVMLAVIRLRWGSIKTHAVQVPLGIRIMVNIVLRRE